MYHDYETITFEMNARSSNRNYFFIEVIDPNGSSKEHACRPYAAKSLIHQSRVFVSMAGGNLIFFQLSPKSKEWLILEFTNNRYRLLMIQFLNGKISLHDLIRITPVHKCISTTIRNGNDSQITLRVVEYDILYSSVALQMPDVYSLELEMHPAFIDISKRLSKGEVLKNMFYIFASLPEDTPLIKLYELYKRLRMYANQIRGYSANYADIIYYKMLSDPILATRKSDFVFQLKNFVFANLQNQTEGTTA